MNAVRITAIISILFAVARHPVLAQAADVGQSICYEVEKSVNALAAPTTTSCVPSKGPTAGSISFLVICNQPVFSTEGAKKAWLLVAVGAVGKSLNDRPAVKADELWLSDLNQTKAKTAYVMPVSVAKNLQRKAQLDQIASLDALYAEIQRALVKREVKR